MKKFLGVFTGAALALVAAVQVFAASGDPTYDYSANSDLVAALPLLAAGFVALIAVVFGVALTIQLAPKGMQLALKAIKKIR